MTTLENIRLCDNEYISILEVIQAQKIKLRETSYHAISAKYINSFPKKQDESVNQETPSATSTDEVTEVGEIVVLHPILVEMYNRVQNGKYKAIKVKESMYDNITAKGANVEHSDNVVENFSADTTPVENVSVEEQAIMEESVQSVELPQEDVTKVSRNGASAAKVEKYMASFNEEVVTDEDQVMNTESIVSPTVIEEENARPVSIVAPERIVEEATKDNDLDTNVDFTFDKENITDVVTDLGQLKEYLARITELKRIAEEAKEQELAEKEAAERAEQEAITTRDTLQKTAEELAAHQKALIEQTEASQAQANLYATQRDEYLAERDEYTTAINDMLAVMGNENSNSVLKGRGM